MSETRLQFRLPLTSVTSQKQRRQLPTHDDAVLAQALQSLAIVLLRMGITAPRAEKLLRVAFVHSAATVSRAHKAPANQSQIATISGVNRVDVRRILRTDSDSVGVPHAKQNRLDLVLTAWRADSRFQDSKGRPRPLTFKGRSSEFSKLVRKHGRDVTPKSILDQLMRSHAVKEKSGKLVMTLKGHGRSSEAIAARADLRFLEAQLHGLSLNLGRRAYVSRSLAMQVTDRKMAKRIQRTMLQRVQVMLSGLGAVSQFESQRPGTKSYRVIVTTNVATESVKELDEI